MAAQVYTSGIVALGFDDSSSGTRNVTVDVGTNGDRVLYVYEHAYDNPSNITGMTYNGVALTLVDNQTSADGRIYLWRLINPASGSNTLAITRSASQEGGITAIPVYGADQTTPEGDTVKASGDSTNPTDTITTTVDDCLVLGGLQHREYSSAFSPSDGQTEHSDFLAGSGIAVRGVTGSIVKATAGSQAMGWTVGSADTWSIILTAVRPSATTITHTTDAALKGALTKTHSTDAYLTKAPVKMAWATGDELSTGSTNLNSAATFTALKLNLTQEYDSSYFDWASGTPTRLVVKQAGDYLITVGLPVTSDGTNTTNRNDVEIEVRKNGTLVPGGWSDSSYIRNSSGHQESSNRATVFVPNVAVDDYIEVYVQRGSTETTNTLTTDGFALMAEYVEDFTMFAARGTRLVGGTDLNPATEDSFEWSTEDRKDTGFTHSTSTNKHQVTLDAAASYLVFASIPFDGAVARANVRCKVKIDGTQVNGGEFKQGMIRNTDGITSGSAHWGGLITTSSANQVLTITLQQEAAAGTLTNGSRDGELIIIKLANTDGVFNAEATQLDGGGNDWNPSSKTAVDWATENIKDTDFYDHSTVTDPHKVTVKIAGDYFLAFNVAFSGAVTRAAPKATVQVNGSDVTGFQGKSGYIRNTSGHNESSDIVIGLLRNLSVNDEITVSMEQEAAAGTINDDTPAILFLWAKTEQVTTVTKTHTTDAYLSGPQTLDFTTDALLQAEFTKQHSTDAYLVAQATLSVEQITVTYGVIPDTFTTTHTTDAYLYQVVSPTHTTDAYLQATPLIVHTTDLLARATFTTEHTTDTLAYLVSETTHDTDALLFATPEKAHSTDTLLTAEFTLQHSADALLYAVQTLQHTTDSLLQAIQENTHDTDALLQAIKDKTHTTDLYAIFRFTSEHTTDALLLEASEKAHTTDAILQGAASLQHLTDALLLAIQSQEHSTDTLLQDSFTADHTTDTYLQLVAVLQHTADALLRATLTAQHTTDGLLQQIATNTHTTDSYLLKFSTQLHTTDALLWAIQTALHTTDALLELVSELSHTSDAYLQAVEELNHTTDGLLLAIQELTHTTDAVLQATFNVVHTTDGLKYLTTENTHTTDGLLQDIVTKSHSTDAWVQPPPITHFTDALLYGVFTVAHQIDALLYAVQTTSHDTDALLYATFNQEHDTDALLQLVASITHATDAYKSKFFTKDHTTDSRLVFQFSPTHNTDAYIIKGNPFVYRGRVVKPHAFTDRTSAFSRKTSGLSGASSPFSRRTPFVQPAPPVTPVMQTRILSHGTDAYLVTS